MGSEFYNKSIKNWLEDNDINVYSTCNEGKSVVVERFIRSLKNKIYKHMTAGSKKVYFNVLNDIADKYNNTYHGTIKMRPLDFKSDSDAEYNVDSNGKFKVSHHVKILKNKNSFAKGYPPNCSEEFFVIKKVKSTVPCIVLYWTFY